MRSLGPFSKGVMAFLVVVTLCSIVAKGNFKHAPTSSHGNGMVASAEPQTRDQLAGESSGPRVVAIDAPYGFPYRSFPPRGIIHLKHADGHVIALTDTPLRLAQLRYDHGLGSRDAVEREARKWDVGSFETSNPVAPWESMVGTPHVVVSEVLYDAPRSLDAKLEFIELYNAGQAVAILGGWKLSDAQEDGFTFPSEVTLPSGEYLVIGKDKALTEAEYGGYVSLSGLTLQLGNKGDVVRLSDEQGAVVDEVAWGTRASPPRRSGDGRSLQRLEVDGSWASLPPSPGTGPLTTSDRAPPETEETMHESPSSSSEASSQETPQKTEETTHESSSSSSEASSQETPPATTNQVETICPGKQTSDLLACLRQLYTPTSTLGYTGARLELYNHIDNKNGSLTCVYGGYSEAVPPGGWTVAGDAMPINLEHTVPQSFFGKKEPMRSDMHHMFPTHHTLNSARSNYPFRELDDVQMSDEWCIDESCSHTLPAPAIRDDYSELDTGTAWEVREDHKGNSCRAVAYFAAIYEQQLASYGHSIDDVITREDLHAWHQADPVDDAELARSAAIAKAQGNENPFVLDSSLLERAFPL